MGTSTPNEHGSPLALRPALRESDSDRYPSPRAGAAKVVSIAKNEEEIPPAPLTEEPSRPKPFTASTAGKRLTGRPTIPISSSRASIRSQASLDDLTLPDAAEHSADKKHGQSSIHHHTHRHDRFVSQVTAWLEAERAKRAARREKRKNRNHASADLPKDKVTTEIRSRTSSQGSDDSTTSLERLQQILEDNLANIDVEPLVDATSTTTPTSIPRRPSYAQLGSKRRVSLFKKLGLGSDTDRAEQEEEVTHVDAILDNTKTMSYSGGAEESPEEPETPGASKRAGQEKEAWATFKLEILKLAHTLHVKGWRAFPFDYSDKIEVTRLSGALTNAVYVVTPPREAPPPEQQTRKHRKADKVLLRVYGPQVDIDRELELSILRRLARKNIGPKMLGTFNNGRFEQFFNAQTLTPADLRDPSTSKQIAKRMRELHDGVDVLDHERREGPVVWQHWEKWMENVERRITHLDNDYNSGAEGDVELWRKRGLVMGVEWPIFKATLERYRKWLDEQYEPMGGVENALVFAHNDTQYGNILRLVPESKEGEAPSPLLLPQNSHRQLIVIDFEYASANTPGLEFANHFTEWCYDYTHKTRSWACTTENYPTLEEQKRFIRTYIKHHTPSDPKPPTATPQQDTPTETGSNPSSPGLVRNAISTVVETVAQLRNPLSTSSSADNAAGSEVTSHKEEEEIDRQVERLLQETRWWRLVNSAFWIVWGITQAKIPKLEALVEGDKSEIEKALMDEQKDESVAAEGHEAEGEKDEDAEFDYLAYSQDRARFFWGDVVSLGLMKMEDLPEPLRSKLKLVEN